MTGLRLLAVASGAALSFGCSMSLNYPIEPAEAPAQPTAVAPSDAAASDGAPEAPVLLGLGFGIPEEDRPDLEELANDDASGRSWYELTRQAREDRQLGNFEAAVEHLEQAALQLSDRAPSNTRRRAVHGMRARLAADLLALDRTEDAEALANTLFEEAESYPETTGAATVELALAYSELRGAAAAEAGLEESQLPLLRIALLAITGVLMGVFLIGNKIGKLKAGLMLGLYAVWTGFIIMRAIQAAGIA